MRCSCLSQVEVRTNILPVLEAAGVDVVLSGHSHSYERSVLLDGHYGLSSTYSACQHAVSNGSGSSASQPYRKPAGFTPHAGTVYVVAGSGGKLEPLGSRHAAMYYSVSQRGSLILDVSPSLLSAQFMTSTGTVIDRFDMEKSVGTVTPSRPFCR